MCGNVAYRGLKLTIEYAIRSDGSTPGLEFFSQLQPQWQARIHHLYRILGDIGRIANDEQFKKFEPPFFEFKAFQVRMPCYFRNDKRVVVTHGFIKKRKGAAPKQEAERAKSIKNEYEAALGRMPRR
jgi:Gp49-like protein DUF891